MVSVCWFLGLWGASLLIPSLGFADAGAPFAPLSVALYLLPWLLAPSTLLYAVVHRKLWSVVEWKNQSSQTIMAETSPALDVQYPEQAHYGEAL
jgi:hypothetical protein